MTEQSRRTGKSTRTAPKRWSSNWRNWSGEVSERSQMAAGPTSETAVKALVIGAGGSQLPVKVVGAGHSFNDIAATEGLRMHLDDYRGLVSVNEQSRVATFRGGTRLSEIPGLLAPHGLALANQGDSDAQTIAGAISTGTHGSGLAFTGLSAMVKSLRIVLADGSIIYCDERMHPEIFEFARLGLGALGVIVEVGMQCVPAFRVEATEGAEQLDEVLESFQQRSRENDHVTFIWYPPAERAYVKTFRRLAAGEEPEGVPPLSKASRFMDGEIVQNWGQGLLSSVGAVAPGIVPRVNQVSSNLMWERQYVADSHEVFVSARRVRFNEVEYAVPFEAGVEAVREIQRLITDNDWRISFPLEVRTAAADDVPLSMAYQRDSMYIAVHRYRRESHLEYFGAVEEVLRDFDGRPHWGKLHSMRAPQFAELYPRFNEFVALRDRLDPDRVFDNHYLERVLGS